MTDFSAQQDAFITAETKATAERYESEVKQALIKKGIVITGALAQSIKSSSQAAAQGKGELALEFLAYGRFVDMGARVGYHKGKRISADDRTRALKGKPPKKNIFYSRIKMGQFGRLAHNLSNKYVETTLDILKNMQPNGR